jgi:HK97 family phage major capsid protein
MKRFKTTSIVGAILAAMFSGPSGRAAQFGRIDLGDKKLEEAFDTIEKSLEQFAEKQKGELETFGKVSTDTLKAVETLGTKQLELADRLLKIEQDGGRKKDDDAPVDKSWGAQVTGDAKFKTWAEGGSTKVRFEVKGGANDLRLFNTVVGSDVTVPPDRRTDIVRGAFRNLRLEQYLKSADTTAAAVEYTRENTFTNNAAETAEGAQKPESAITFTLVNQPVATVAHWIKISRQLSKDAPALAAYINERMRYGVNKRVEDQLISGNGTPPNIAGLLATGNYTAHGYSSAGLGAVNQKLKLIRRVIADLATSDYPADMIILNSSDWADIELMVDTQNRYLVGDPSTSKEPGLWGLPVIPSNAMPVDSFLVMSRMAATVYNREGVIVEMSESD